MDITPKDRLLDTQDDIELYLKDLVKIKDALFIVGNRDLGNKIAIISDKIGEETRKAKSIVKDL